MTYYTSTKSWIKQPILGSRKFQKGGKIYCFLLLAPSSGGGGNYIYSGWQIHMKTRML